MQLKVLQLQGLWEGLNPPREEETNSQMGKKSTGRETAEESEFSPDKAVRTWQAKFILQWNLWKVGTALIP